MDVLALVASSALVSAVVGGAVAYVSQRSLARNQADVNYEFEARRRLYRLLGSADPVPYLQESIDWNVEDEHVNRDNLRRAARALLTESGSGGQRVVDYSSFRDCDMLHDSRLKAVVELFESCEDHLTENPVWWVRVVGFAYACKWLVVKQGRDLGFDPMPMQEPEVRDMIGAVDADRKYADRILERLDDYPKTFDKVLDRYL